MTCHRNPGPTDEPAWSRALGSSLTEKIVAEPGVKVEGKGMLCSLP
jgi:hypothetical protein